MEEIAPGIWHWVEVHPRIKIPVSSYYLPEERVVIDPLAPREGLDFFEEQGYSIGYAVDFSDLTADMAALYEGVDVWIADCLTRSPHPTHMHVDGIVAMARELRVGALYLVHMGTSLDYRTLASELPDWATPAHDGLEIGA